MKQSLIALTALLLFAAAPAIADDGFYLGGSIGRTNIDTGSIQNIQVSADANSYKGFLGYRFLKFFAVEGAYADMGSAKDSGGTAQSEVKLKAWHGEAMAFLPFVVGDLFAKAGMASWKGDFTSTAPTLPSSASKSGTDPVYGGGIQFRIKSWAIRGEVEYFDIKNASHVYMYSVGGSYTF